MNSFASIYKPKGTPKFDLLALNGGDILEPYVGTFTWEGGTYTQMFAFTATSGQTSLRLPETKMCGMLIVAGGGGGGCTNYNSREGAGGGGAGGAIVGTLQLNAGATYTIAVGNQGARSVASTNGAANPGNAIPGTNGGNTVVSGAGVSETAFGGGRGGYINSGADATTSRGIAGGSSGGSMANGTVETRTMIASAGSASTNPRSLAYRGTNGGTGTRFLGVGGYGGGGGGGGAMTNGKAGSSTDNGMGGMGYLFQPSGLTNEFTGKYYATGGCGGSASNNSLNQSAILSWGGVPGGTQTTPVPADPTTYGTGGSGGWGSYQAAGNTGNNSGANGAQGICIVLVP